MPRDMSLPICIYIKTGLYQRNESITIGFDIQYGRVSAVCDMREMKDQISRAKVTKWALFRIWLLLFYVITKQIRNYGYGC